MRGADRADKKILPANGEAQGPAKTTAEVCDPTVVVHRGDEAAAASDCTLVRAACTGRRYGPMDTGRDALHCSAACTKLAVQPRMGSSESPAVPLMIRILKQLAGSATPACQLPHYR